MFDFYKKNNFNEMQQLTIAGTGRALRHYFTALFIQMENIFRSATLGN